MKVLLRVLNTESQAADGSRVPRNVIEEYLASDDYKLIIQDKLSLGGITHKDRKVDPKYGNLIGPDDQLLISDNITHYITKLFFKDNDNFLYAIIEVFNPELFEGERRRNIINLIGDLKSGVKLPVSIVIHAYWDAREVAQSIIRIKGVDFTINPSFEGASTVKVMSNYEPELEVKKFSNSTPNSIIGEVHKATKIFSADVVEILDDEVDVDQPKGAQPDYLQNMITRDEIVRKYGLKSEIAKETKNFSIMTLDQFKEITDKIKRSGSLDKFGNQLTSLEEYPTDIDQVIEDYKKTIEDGDVKVLQQILNGNKRNIIQLLMSVPKDEPNRKEILLMRLNEFLRNNPRTASFSSVNSVKDRMLFDKYPRYSLINRIVRSYKLYWDTNKDRLSDKEVNLLKTLFVQDLNLLIKVTNPRIKKGATLQSLFALSQFNQEISQAGIKLSRTYRKLIIAEEVLGFIPSKRYLEWSSDLKNFYNEFCTFVFGSPYGENITVLDKL